MISLCGEADVAKCGRHRRVINATSIVWSNITETNWSNSFVIKQHLKY